MEPLTIASLVSALGAADPAQWSVLRDRLHGELEGSGELSGIFRLAEAESAGPGQHTELATLLIAKFATAAALRLRLLDWISMVNREAGKAEIAQPPNPAGRHGNLITGSAQFAGTTVQARDIQGGIHLHAPAAQLPVPHQLLPAPAYFTGRRQPVSVTAAALARESERLSVLRLEGDNAVQSALEASYQGLPVDAARLYRLLGQLPFTSFSVGLAAATAELDLAEAELLLDALAEVNLLEEEGLERYRFHDLVRLHAHAAEADRTAAEGVVRRAVSWYLAVATATEAIISPAPCSRRSACAARSLRGGSRPRDAGPSLRRAGPPPARREPARRSRR
ncbi:hypothetical protein [Kitasatospora sp. GP82]|uniref:hypothetical protein n=1 Tax=Kitasatospora sp. GP82 TaxID=3035089 RepID=UPI002473AC07|nr:hypothetical protein [Kitasatospora sp. GP82]MDH6128879.1 hypothetical protein [Kitasatospora sp. GP82]